ncbi:hypothetical protein DL93DRAFT_2159016 [Clavulina sp. PMI_390]|nr:hypothetical protein DL93DRAFT_2159016 [Clavulina sp. PMI_390]
MSDNEDYDAGGGGDAGFEDDYGPDEPQTQEDGDAMQEDGPSGAQGKQPQQEAPRQPNTERITTPYLTKYERARVLGTRALQISMNAPILVPPEGETDPLQIAIKELAQKKIPLIIRRYLPDGSFEDCGGADSSFAVVARSRFGFTSTVQDIASNNYSHNQMLETKAELVVDNILPPPASVDASQAQRDSAHSLTSSPSEPNTRSPRQSVASIITAPHPLTSPPPRAQRLSLQSLSSVPDANGHKRYSAEPPLGTHHEHSESWDHSHEDGNPPDSSASHQIPNSNSHQNHPEDSTATPSSAFIPKSSYYTGPPGAGSAFGTDPVGEIGVHYPREILRVERDYSAGEIPQFHSTFPLELEGRITPTQFQETINDINELLISAHDLGKSARYNALAAFTLYVSTLVMSSHYDQEMQKLEALIEEKNANLYQPQGLRILWPRKTAFLFLEIEYYSGILINTLVRCSTPILEQ